MGDESPMHRRVLSDDWEDPSLSYTSVSRNSVDNDDAAAEKEYVVCVFTCVRACSNCLALVLVFCVDDVSRR